MSNQNQNPIPNYPPRWLRQAHAKQHGCIRAIVTVLGGLDTPYEQGIFQSGATYPAFIRYSNGVGRGFAAPPVASNETDLKPDTRGMALKLFNVTGTFIETDNSSQSFTFTTSRLGFLPTPESAVGFFTAVQQGAVSLAAWLLLNPYVAALFAKLSIDGAITNVLTADFWTAPAQMHGPSPAKYHIYPCPSWKPSGIVPEVSNILDPNFLRDQLIADIWTNLDPSEEVCLRWAVQLYSDNSSTPIDDTTIGWTTPFTDVAEIRIPRQYSWSEGQDAFCRLMSFNPWLGITDHKPVGFLQEIRQAVYGNGAIQRRQLLNEPNFFASYQNWEDYPSY